MCGSYEPTEEESKWVDPDQSENEEEEDTKGKEEKADAITNSNADTEEEQMAEEVMNKLKINDEEVTGCANPLDFFQ